MDKCPYCGKSKYAEEPTGFTIIDLLVVCAVIAILAAIAFPIL